MNQEEPKNRKHIKFEIGDDTDGDEAEILRMHQAVLRNRKINSIL